MFNLSDLIPPISVLVWALAVPLMRAPKELCLTIDDDEELGQELTRAEKACLQFGRSSIKCKKQVRVKTTFQGNRLFSFKPFDTAVQSYFLLSTKLCSGHR